MVPAKLHLLPSIKQHRPLRSRHEVPFAQGCQKQSLDALTARMELTLDDFSLHAKPLAPFPAFLYNYFRYP
jgi:hypothetical protein